MKTVVIKIPKLGRTITREYPDFVPRDDLLQHIVKPAGNDEDLKLRDKDFFIAWYNEGQTIPNESDSVVEEAELGDDELEEEEAEEEETEE